MDSVFLDDYADPGGCVSGLRPDELKTAMSGFVRFIRSGGTEKTVLNGVEPRINHEKDLSGEQRRNKQEKA